MATDDFAGYFSQLLVRHRQRSRQGMCLPRADGHLDYLISNRVMFGGSSAPQHAQRVTNAVLHRTLCAVKGFGELTRRVARGASRG